MEYIRFGWLRVPTKVIATDVRTGFLLLLIFLLAFFKYAVPLLLAHRGIQLLLYIFSLAL